MRFDVNISMLFTDLPLSERPRAAAAAGFKAVELWWPFERSDPSPSAISTLVASIQDAGLSLVCLNFDGGDFQAGERGLLSLPEMDARFRDSVEAAVAVATPLGCRVLNALYGNQRPDLPTHRQDEIAVERLAFAAERVGTIGATVVLEALNPHEFPAYGLHTVEAASDLCERVRLETGAAVGCLFDVYNVQRSEGDLIVRMQAQASRIAHVQIADAPGRGRPGTGEIAYKQVFAALERMSYGGYVGLEYKPSADAADTFAWLPPEFRAGDIPLSALPWSM